MTTDKKPAVTLEEAIKKSVAQHLAELQAQPLTPEDVGAFYQRLKATGVIKVRAGLFEPEIRPRNAVYVDRECLGKTVASIQVVQEGRCASRSLTAAEARYIAELLLAAAGEAQ